MRNAKQLLTAGVLALTLTSPLACRANTEKSEPTVLLANAKAHKPSKQYVKIALLLDTSNSMDGLINQAKAQLWDIVNEFTYARCGNDSRPSLQIALYEYGNDHLSSREGYIRQVIGFSSDLDEISEKLFSLTTNGGEEYCGQVINASLKQLNWGRNRGDLKMIFIAGNEPFTQGKLNYRDAAYQAKEKDVIVNTIFCGNYEQGISTQWKKGAELTGGDYMAIDHNRQIVHIDTPYDDIIIQLNSRLNNTYISYGYAGARKKQMQVAQDANAEALEEAVVVKRAVSKSSRLYNNSSWDLVDASEDEEFDVSKLKKDELPTALKGKSTAEIEKFIEEKKAERVQIQKQIQELNVKREAYIAKNQKEEAGELENAMISAIKAQAAKKNYNWQ